MQMEMTDMGQCVTFNGHRDNRTYIHRAGENVAISIALRCAPQTS